MATTKAHILINKVFNLLRMKQSDTQYKENADTIQFWQANIIFLNPTFIASFHAQGLRIVSHHLPHEVQVSLLYFQTPET